MTPSRRAAAALLSAVLLPAAVFAFSPAAGTGLRLHRAPACSPRGSRYGAAATTCAAGGKPLVAMTRELGKNGKLERLLKERGLDTVEIPCITFERGVDIEKLPSAIKDSEWEYIIITSPEAASVFLPVWDTVGRPGVRVAAVGAATRTALQAGGIEPVFMPSKATGKNLADEIPGPSANGRVLYPASAKARSEVQGGLTMRGFSCTRLNTYDTVSAVWDAEQLRLAKLVDVVALASPSAVKTWTERVGTSQRCACIGSTSAKSCEEAGFEHVFFPSHPGVEGWATSVFEALQLEKTQP